MRRSCFLILATLLSAVQAQAEPAFAVEPAFAAESAFQRLMIDRAGANQVTRASLTENDMEVLGRYVVADCRNTDLADTLRFVTPVSSVQEGSSATLALVKAGAVVETFNVDFSVDYDTPAEQTAFKIKCAPRTSPLVFDDHGQSLQSGPQSQKHFDGSSAKLNDAYLGTTLSVTTEAGNEILFAEPVLIVHYTRNQQANDGSKYDMIWSYGFVLSKMTPAFTKAAMSSHPKVADLVDIQTREETRTEYVLVCVRMGTVQIPGNPDQPAHEEPGCVEYGRKPIQVDYDVVTLSPKI